MAKHIAITVLPVLVLLVVEPVVALLPVAHPLPPPPLLPPGDGGDVGEVQRDPDQGDPNRRAD